MSVAAVEKQEKRESSMRKISSNGQPLDDNSSDEDWYDDAGRDDFAFARGHARSSTSGDDDNKSTSGSSRIEGMSFPATLDDVLLAFELYRTDYWRWDRNPNATREDDVAAILATQVKLGRKVLLIVPFILEP
jgi:hypothetical protein